jgi:hypothetical protein
MFGKEIYFQMLESVKQKRDFAFEVPEEFMDMYNKEIQLQNDGIRLTKEMLESFKLENIYGKAKENIKIIDNFF